MRKSTIYFLAVIIVAFAAPVQSTPPSDQLTTYGQLAWQQSAEPIRPGIPGERPFWNAHAKRFIYAPAFDFKSIDGAENYQFVISYRKSDTPKAFTFTADTPYAPLSPVWTKMPVGQFNIDVIALSDTGTSIGLAGKGSYYRAAPFNGIYHQPPVLPYDESAKLALGKLLHKDYVEHWLIHKKPDWEYINYRYPAKIYSALVVGAVTQARLTTGTAEADHSTSIARIVADYLIDISVPEGAAWEYFPPTYYGPLMKKKSLESHHMQLTNCLTIMGADAGNAYLDLYDLTGETKYIDAARRIARTYVDTQLASGTWYLYVNHKSGEPVAENLAIPTAVVNYFDRLHKDYNMTEFEAASEKALTWIMDNPVKTFNWQGQFEDVRPPLPYRNQSREQACDLAIYLFKNNKNVPLAEDLVRFAEDQFVIWEQPRHFSVKPKSKKRGWKSTDWMFPSVQEQYTFWMPVNRAAGIMITTYWQAYAATGKDIYLAKAKSIANNITRVQAVNNGDYTTMFMKYPWKHWLNSTVYPARVMMTLESNLHKAGR